MTYGEAVHTINSIEIIRQTERLTQCGGRYDAKGRAKNGLRANIM